MFYSYSLAWLWKWPSSSEAIYGGSERVLNGTIMRPSVPQRAQILLLNLIPYKLHSPHFLCIVGLAQAENNLDSERSVLQLKQDKALTNFGPED